MGSLQHRHTNQNTHIHTYVCVSLLECVYVFVGEKENKRRPREAVNSHERAASAAVAKVTGTIGASSKHEATWWSQCCPTGAKYRFGVVPSTLPLSHVGVKAVRGAWTGGGLELGWWFYCAEQCCAVSSSMCVCVLQPPLSFVVCCVICSSVLLFLFLCRFSAVLFVLFSCLDDVVLALVVLPLIVAVAGSLQTHTDRGTRAHTHTGMAGWCFLFCCFVLDRQCNFPLHIFPSAHTLTCSLRMFYLIQ